MLGRIRFQRWEENQKLGWLVADDLKSVLCSRGYYQGVVLSHDVGLTVDVDLQLAL